MRIVQINAQLILIDSEIVCGMLFQLLFQFPFSLCSDDLFAESSVSVTSDDVSGVATLALFFRSPSFILSSSLITLIKFLNFG